MFEGKIRRLSLTAIGSCAAVFAFTGLAATSAGAAPVVNGGFETGTLEGWSAAAETGAGGWFALSGTTPPLSGSVGGNVLAPFEGTYDAVADQESPDSNILSQEVALIPGVSHELSLEFNYQSVEPLVTPFPDTLSVLGAGNQQVRVDVMKAGSPLTSLKPSDILATLLQTETGDPEEIGWTRLTADLTPFAGQTVRIRVVDANNEGNLFAGLDAVSITNSVPAPLPPTPTPTPVTPPAPPAPTCKVPKLKGKKLKAAKKAIKTADCKVGKVTKKNGITAKTGKVVKQSPKVGASKPAGSKVNLTLG